jgi:adenylyltransferase/sulfurtransferase
MTLSEQEKSRYHRQMIFPNWGEETQLKLKNATVFVAGAGGLGSPVSIYLAVAGVGTIRICDYSTPELSNLNRQILHDDTRLGKNKALSAQETLNRINPEVTVEPLVEMITEESVAMLIGNNTDLIVDCMDNFETRQILNNYAVKHRIPMIHAGVYGMRGQITFIKSPETPCLWCMHTGTLPKTVFPIVGATAGVIGCLEALEAIKYLTGMGTNLMSRMLIWDGFTMEFTELPQKKMLDCPVCGTNGFAEVPS